ncbi:MAG: aminotransferase class V-fold PLP-dependent enzyme [Phaeodactylibacter sp.]|nr:aminotransferase class V-fold PLP-dependent enzyme [Phaeodactylibacter sp.]
MNTEQLKQIIEALAAEAAPLEVSKTDRSAWNRELLDYSERFLDQIQDLPAYDPVAKGSAVFDQIDFGENGRPIDAVLETLWQEVDRQGLNPASGGHLGYIPGGGIYPTAMGDFLAAITNRYAGIFFGGPGAVRLENQLIRWMCRLVGFPETALGNLTSGGSIANLIALVTARDVKGIKAVNIPKAVIYLTEQVHHCVQKALRIGGLGEAVIRYVPMDERFRMDAGVLAQQVAEDKQAGLRPLLVVGSAGTTDVGAIDPLDAIAEVAQANDLWFHIDAAYGGFFLLVDQLKDRFKGIERADSVAIDPHKGLFLSYGLGAVLIKDVQAQYNTHYYRANYMQDAARMTEEYSPADLSPELTKHFRGLRMWLSLELFGLAPFRACLAEKHALAHYFYYRIQELGFEVGPEPELSVVTYRYVPKQGDADAFNDKLVQLVRQDGRVFVSSTQIAGQFWIRLAVLSFRTHLWHIEHLLQLLGQASKDQ